MPSEFWLAVASGLIASGGVLTAVVIKYRFSKNGSGSITTAQADYVEDKECVKDMEAAEKLVESKLATVQTSIENQGREIGEIKIDISKIETTTGEIHRMVTAMDERRRA